jgi:hypothetical protein
MTDDDVLDELRSLLGRVDPAPPEVTAAAKGLLSWRRVDAELAELLSDSLLESGSLALTRSGATAARSVVFASGELTIDLMIRAEDDRRRLLGQLAPAIGATIEVQLDDGTIAATATADALGRFQVELASAARIRLRVYSGDERSPSVETSWLPL